MVAASLIGAEVGKLGEILHTDVGAHGKDNIEPIAAVLTLYEGLRVVIGINKCVIVVSRNELSCKLTNYASEKSGYVLSLELGSRRENYLRHKSLNADCAESGNNILIGSGLIYNCVIVACINSLIAGTEEILGVISCYILKSLAKIGNELCIIALCPIDCSLCSIRKHCVDCLADKIVECRKNGGITRCRSSNGAVVCSCGHKLVNEITGDGVVPVNELSERISGGHIKLEPGLCETVFADKAIIAVAVGAYCEVRPLPVVCAGSLRIECLYI